MSGYHYNKTTSLTSAVSEVVKLDNIPLTLKQPPQVYSLDSVALKLEWISHREELYTEHMYTVILPQVKNCLR